MDARNAMHSAMAAATGTAAARVNAGNAAVGIGNGNGNAGAAADETEAWRELMSPKMFATFSAVYHNDASVTVVDTLPDLSFTDNHGHDVCLPLGQALALNSHVTTLTMSLGQVYPSNQKERAWSNKMLSWIRRSLTLRSIEVHEGPDDDGFACRVFDALSRNSRLEVVRVISVFNFSSPLRLLRKSRALRTLHLGCCTVNGAYLDNANNDVDRRVLADAFGVNSTLEELILEPDEGDINFVTIALLLPPLSRNPRFRELHLHVPEHQRDVNPSFMTALQSFLIASPSLCHLSISFTFNIDTMNQLLAGFRQSQSLSKVTLNSCSMDKEALDALVAYFQSERALPSLGVTDRLQIQGRDMERGYAEVVVEDVFTPILLRSSLQELELCDAEDCLHQIEFYQSLIPIIEQSPSLKRLKLGLAYHEQATMEVIAQCLPQLLRLRELDIDLRVSHSGDDVVDTESLLRALQQNTSLHRFALREYSLDSPFSRFSTRPVLNESDTELVRSIGLRNKHVPEMLNRPKLSESEDRDEDDASLNQERTDVEMFPDLFASKMRCPRTGTNTFLTGLLALDNELDVPTSACRSSSSGPNLPNKRFKVPNH